MNCNRQRGEIIAKLDGAEHKLCLTLGALAELESAFCAEDLKGLVGRISTGNLSALDMTRIIGAGLRGAGAEITDEDVSAMQADGSMTGFARIVSELMAATFGIAGSHDARTG